MGCECAGTAAAGAFDLEVWAGALFTDTTVGSSNRPSRSAASTIAPPTASIIVNFVKLLVVTSSSSSSLSS